MLANGSGGNGGSMVVLGPADPDDDAAFVHAVSARDGWRIVDAAIAPHSDIALADCDPIERNVLRLAAFELMYRLDIPVRVAVNESVELTKLFGAEGGYKYVNGVVDKLAHVARKVEMG